MWKVLRSAFEEQASWPRTGVCFLSSPSPHLGQGRSCGRGGGGFSSLSLGSWPSAVFVHLKRSPPTPWKVLEKGLLHPSHTSACLLLHCWLLEDNCCLPGKGWLLASSFRETPCCVSFRRDVLCVLFCFCFVFPRR